jgi:hypothetical protein
VAFDRRGEARLVGELVARRRGALGDLNEPDGPGLPTWSLDLGLIVRHGRASVIVAMVEEGDVLPFLIAYGQVSGELARLLDVKFVPGDPSQLGHTGAALARVILLHNAKDSDGRDIEFTRLQLLADDLRLLERERPDVFAAVRKKLQDPNEHNYFGSRHEVSTAVALLQRGMHSFRYEQPGEADFEVEARGTTVGIECGSVHMTGTARVTRDLDYKIRSCINAKGAKPYASTAVALCIDATNVQALTLQRGSLLWGNEEDPWLDEVSAESRFGSLVLCATLHNREVEEIQRTYGRFDSPTADAALVECLDRVFPQDSSYVQAYSVLPRT